jgi:hypothetical protein
MEHFNMKRFIGLIIIFIFFSNSFSQHRGDNLAYQGMSKTNDLGVKALAMGGAFTAISGNINSLFFNPAGLADINKFQFSISANSYQKLWRENQTYRPNRFQITLPFYLEGLYTPNPANNGKWDYDIFNDERDSTYIVREPVLGEDPFGKEAADWEEKENSFVFNNISAAIPMKVLGKQLVVSGSYNTKYNVLDFDRNDTYLNPHIGYDEYGETDRVGSNDTLHMDWSRFLRKRTGNVKNITLGVGYKLDENVNVGFGFNRFSGKTQDLQTLNKVGWFDITSNNKFRFSYDTLNTSITGNSEFSGYNFYFGTHLTFNRIQFGLSIYTPYSINRSWNNRTITIDTLQTDTKSASGKDKLKIEAIYALGVSFNPIDQFIFSLDIETTPFSQGTFELASGDATHREWLDRTNLCIGAEYKPFSWLSVLAGYRNLPTIFAPDGAAFRDRGPSAESYTFGFSFGIFIGRLDAAYEIRQLKYYDSYYSNTNYVMETFNNFLFGYTISY